MQVIRAFAFSTHAEKKLASAFSNGCVLFTWVYLHPRSFKTLKAKCHQAPAGLKIIAEKYFEGFKHCCCNQSLSLTGAVQTQANIVLMFFFQAKVFSSVFRGLQYTVNRVIKYQMLFLFLNILHAYSTPIRGKAKSWKNHIQVYNYNFNCYVPPLHIVMLQLVAKVFL